MTHRPSSADQLLSASHTLGADALFLRMVRLVASKEHGTDRLDEPAVRERLAALREEFARDCASVVERRLGREQALRSLAALASEPVQGFLEARFTMAPAVAGHLQILRKKIAELEL